MRVIALSTDVAKADFFFALISDVKMITIDCWTSAQRETSCKIIHDKYNADPFVCLRGKRSDRVDEWQIEVWRLIRFTPTQDLVSIPATSLERV